MKIEKRSNLLFSLLLAMQSKVNFTVEYPNSGGSQTWTIWCIRGVRTDFGSKRPTCYSFSGFGSEWAIRYYSEGSFHPYQWRELCESGYKWSCCAYSEVRIREVSWGRHVKTGLVITFCRSFPPEEMDNLNKLLNSPLQNDCVFFEDRVLFRLGLTSSQNFTSRYIVLNGKIPLFLVLSALFVLQVHCWNMWKVWGF